MHTIDKFLFWCQNLVLVPCWYFSYICQRCNEIQALFIAEHIDIFTRKNQTIPRISIEVECISVLLARQLLGSA